MNETRIQKVAIIIIKTGNEILLQENKKWKDLSFIGGKYEEEDHDMIRTAYREVNEELFLIPETDFTLFKLQPENINLEKISQRTNEITQYSFFPFFMKLTKISKEKIPNKENYWVSLSEIEHGSYKTKKLSELVIEITPKLILTDLESFTVGNSA
jgi:8-oxo-dGTP pyrophosphatase MutT (NUDIX family)